MRRRLLAIIAIISIVAIAACARPPRSPPPRGQRDAALLATMENPGVHVSVDADFVFVLAQTAASWSSLYRVPRAGGDAELLYGPAPFGRRLAFCGDRVVWTFAARGAGPMDRILSLRKRAPRQPADLRRADPREEPRVLVEGENDPDELVGDGQSLYWTVYRGENGAVHKTSCDGGRVSEIAQTSLPGPLAIAAGDLLVGDRDRIRAVPLAGGARREIARAEGSVVTLAADATHVYWIEAPRDEQAFTATAAERPRRIRRAPLAGGAAETVAPAEALAAYIAVGASRVCWGRAVAVVCSAVTGGTARTLAAGAPHWHDAPLAFALAEDGAFISLDENLVALPLP